MNPTHKTFNKMYFQVFSHGMIGGVWGSCPDHTEMAQDLAFPEK